MLVRQRTPGVARPRRPTRALRETARQRRLRRRERVRLQRPTRAPRERGLPAETNPGAAEDCQSMETDSSAAGEGPSAETDPGAAGDCLSTETDPGAARGSIRRRTLSVRGDRPRRHGRWSVSGTDPGTARDGPSAAGDCKSAETNLGAAGEGLSA